MSVCPLGYFGDTAARRCRRCYKGCETCSGRSPTQCLSCRRGFYHHQEMNTCVTFCPAGFYADESKCMSVCIGMMSQPPSLGWGPFSWENFPRESGTSLWTW